MPYDIILGRDKSDKKKLGDKGLIFLGKSYVTMGQYTSLSNPIYMDVARSHVVLVAGKRGSGKCLTGDTLITLEDGTQVPIENLEENDKRVIALNDKLKLENSPKSDFFSREVDKIIKIRLRSGKEIKLTPEHPLLTLGGWRPVINLGLGSRIATPRKIPAFGNKQMPEHEIKILSYLLAEGHTKKVVLFANSDEQIVEDFISSLNKFDSSLKLIKEKENHYRISSPNWKAKVLQTGNIRNEKGQFTNENKNVLEKRSIRKLIENEEMFGLLATQKYLSQNIMKLNKNSISLFLNRLFSCDGSIYKVNNYWEISYSSSSQKLIKQIHHLLLRFGIISRIRTKKIRNKGKNFISFEIVINAQNALKFIEEIGFFGAKEKKQIIAYEEIKSRTRNPNIDTIPKEIWKFYKPENWAAIGRAVGYRHPKAIRERARYAPSRQTLLQIAEVEQHIGLKTLAESDIFWDEIVSMEILDGNFKVYDICVPENHNFVANDIIVHNSYTLGVMTEEISNLPPETSRNIASLIFDTMGIFWTMKFKNDKEKYLLDEWGLKTKQLPIKVFAPFGKIKEYQDKSIPVDETFALKPSELEAEDWIITFNLSMTSQEGALISKIISDLKEKLGDFTIEDIIHEISLTHSATAETKNITSALFLAANTWGIFSKDEKGTEISELIEAGKTSILDLSVYSSIGAFNVRALVIGLISRKLFQQRIDARKKEEIQAIQHGLDYMSYSAVREMPLVWMFIDEAHEFLPKEGKTPATDALVQLLREGRQPGISLVLATQQPGQIHTDVMTQSDIVLSHRVTSKQDIEALNGIMQTYLLESIRKKMDDLPSLKGSAIILDDNSERIYPLRMRPRFTWHGGEAPTAVKAEAENI